MLVLVSYISDSCDRCLQNKSLHNTAVILLHNQTVTRNLPPPPPNQTRFWIWTDSPVTSWPCDWTSQSAPELPVSTPDFVLFSNTSTVGAAVGALALTAGTIPGKGRTEGHRRSRSYKSHIMVTHPTSCPRWSSTAPAWCFSDLLWRTEQTAPYGGFLISLLCVQIWKITRRFLSGFYSGVLELLFLSTIVDSILWGEKNLKFKKISLRK